MHRLAILVIVLNIGREAIGEEQDEDFPSSLYLYDEAEHVFKKSESSIPEIEVVKAGMTGTGCFLLFKKENFNWLIHKVDWATDMLFVTCIICSACVNLSALG